MRRYVFDLLFSTYIYMMNSQLKKKTKSRTTKRNLCKSLRRRRRRKNFRLSSDQLRRILTKNPRQQALRRNKRSIIPLWTRFSRTRMSRYRLMKLLRKLSQNLRHRRTFYVTLPAKQCSKFKTQATAVCFLLLFFFVCLIFILNYVACTRENHNCEIIKI